MARIDKINTQIAGRPEGVKIFYFVSEDRGIIEEVINKSNSMKNMLGYGEYQEMDLYEDLKDKKKIKAYERIATVYDERVKFSEDFIYETRDFQAFSRNERAWLVKHFLDNSAENTFFMISSPQSLVPDGFEDSVYVINAGEIDLDDIREIVCEDADSEDSEWDNMYELEEEHMRRLVGFSEEQIRHILTQCSPTMETDREKRIAEFEKLVDDMRKRIAAAGAPLQILNVKPDEHIVGMGAYSSWLREGREAFINPEEAMNTWGEEAPKGVLMVGVPGTGKTAMAREAARVLGGKGERKRPLPLIALKLDAIDSSDYGESQAAMRRYLKRTEAMAPCVLLIDEIEKNFPTKKDSTHEVKMQQVSILLDWLQEREASVFTFITANSIKNVPDELFRSGRLSERYYVFLPTCDELVQILCQKLRERRAKMKKDTYALDDLLGDKELQEKAKALFDKVAKTKTAKFFTGADIVEVVNNAMKMRKKEIIEGDAATSDKMWEALERSATECVAQGQSGMENIISIWFEAKKKEYKNVSKNDYFPFDKYNEGDVIVEKRFETSPDFKGSEYDKKLYEDIRKEIDKMQKDMDTEKKLREKYANGE